MGSLEEEERARKELVVTQVGFGGFDESVSAKELIDFLELEAGLIWRCRVKHSWTPPESYPNYSIVDVSDVPRKDDYAKVVPHAFVHFGTPDAAKRAINAAGKCELVLKGHPLVVNSGTESSSRVNRRRTTDAFRFYDVGVEIGTLASRDEFLVAWKGPNRGVNFHIDPFDGCCRILFSKETAFAFKDIKEMAVMKCDFQVEFLVRDINEIKLFTDQYPFVMQILDVVATLNVISVLKLFFFNLRPFCQIDGKVLKKFCLVLF